MSFAILFLGITGIILIPPIRQDCCDPNTPPPLLPTARSVYLLPQVPFFLLS